MKCFNKSNQVYQELLAVAKSSGISNLKLDIYVNMYLDKYNRFPHLDEIPNIDSYEYLKEKLEIETVSDMDIVSTEKLKEFTGKETVEEQMAFLNNKYSDKEISIVPGIATSIIHIDHRASIYDGSNPLDIDWDSTLTQDKIITNTGTLEKTSSVGILNNIIQRLLNRHGVSIQEYTNDALPENAPDNASSVNAFILNGTIYINTDNAKADAPLHELLHLILGQLRGRNFQQYETLLKSLEQSKWFEKKFKEYQEGVYANRTQLDIYEEILVSEFAKFITTSDKGIFGSMTDAQVQDIFNEVMYAIDTILLPVQSVKTLNPKEVLTSNIVSLSKKLGSALILTEYMGTIDFNTALESRKLSNLKQNLMKEGYLKQECE